MWASMEDSYEVDIEEVAFHEAGHFVARYALLPQEGFELVTVEPRLHSVDGVTQKVLGACEESIDPSEGPEGQRFWEPCAIGLYAGYAAQVKLRPSSEERARRAAWLDFRMARELTFKLFDQPPTPEVLAQSGERLLNAAHLLVADAWPAIEALARALVAELTLDGMRARQIVAAADPETE
jgi:hypothetical protein